MIYYEAWVPVNRMFNTADNTDSDNTSTMQTNGHLLHFFCQWMGIVGSIQTKSWQNTSNSSSALCPAAVWENYTTFDSDYNHYRLTSLSEQLFLLFQKVAAQASALVTLSVPTVTTGFTRSIRTEKCRRKNFTVVSEQCKLTHTSAGVTLALAMIWNLNIQI